MTNLVETISVKITLHRDEHPDFPYDDILGLARLEPKGRARVGCVTWEWERFGCEEVAEVHAADN
jgi:hypothetical protein